jgi:ribosomal protein S18 acetylase RimI-like enzyme
MHTIILYVDELHRAEVIQLWETAFAYEDAHNKPGLAIDKKLEARDRLFFVALEGGHVVGTVLGGYDGHRGWLYSVAVHPLHQGNGIGSDLVRAAERALIERGCMKINLQIRGGNESVAAFYEALGYAVEKRVSLGKRISANTPLSDQEKL